MGSYQKGWVHPELLFRVDRLRRVEVLFFFKMALPEHHDEALFSGLYSLMRLDVSHCTQCTILWLQRMKG